MCSKQDYEAIAEFLAEEVYADKLQAEGAGGGIDLNRLVARLTRHFARRSPTFNIRKFESAVYAPSQDAQTSNA